MAGDQRPGAGSRPGRAGEASDEPRVRPAEASDLAPIRAAALASEALEPTPGVRSADLERAFERIAAEPESTFVAVDADGVVAGYLAPQLNDLTVHPAHRRRGHGRRLVEEGVRLLAAAGRPGLRLYVPHAPSGGHAFAERVGLRFESSLWLFELGGTVPVPDAVFPADVVARSFDLDDVAAYTAMLNAAFADHPSPLVFSETIVRSAHTRPGSDRRMTLVLAEAAAPDVLIGACRTRLAVDDDGTSRGEIAVVGLLPAWRNRGLGRELLRWGIGAVRSRGATVVELAVEAKNEHALRLYRQTGFVPSVEWPQWVPGPELLAAVSATG